MEYLGHKLMVDHFGIYGYVAYVHVHNKKRTKLNNEGENAFLLLLVIIQKLINCSFLSLRNLW